MRNDKIERGIALRPTYWASVSGGKDSLLMLKIILDNPQKYPLTGVVHFELEIDYPFIKDVVDYMESECKRLGVRFIRIKPKKSWYELYEKYGFPTRVFRWCNREYKLNAAKQLNDYMRSFGCYVVYYIGYCADEEKRFAVRKNANRTEVYPLVQEGIIEQDVLEWAKDQPIFRDYYKTNKRCGCMFCPMASRVQMAYLLKYYPDKYREMISLIRETEFKLKKKTGKDVAVMSGNPKYNADYIDNITRSKWLEKLDEMEKMEQ